MTDYALSDETRAKLMKASDRLRCHCAVQTRPAQPVRSRMSTRSPGRAKTWSDRPSPFATFRRARIAIPSLCSATRTTRSVSRSKPARLAGCLSWTAGKMRGPHRQALFSLQGLRCAVAPASYLMEAFATPKASAGWICRLTISARRRRPNLTLHEALDINVPICCGDAPVFPGDVLVGDGDGVMIIPAHLADEIAEECAGMESFEEFVLEQVQDGAAVIGLYPPTTDKAQNDYAQWRKRTGR